MDKQSESGSSGIPAGNFVVDAPKQLAKEATWILRRCTKPNRKEYIKIVQAVVMGFLVMGFVGYFTKLIHIPINNIIGGKTRRRGKNDTEGDKRELTFKTEGQEYAYVTKMVGGSRLNAVSVKGENLLVHIRGSMRKKVWIVTGNLVLVSEREFEKPKEGAMRNVDLLVRYSDDEEAQLRKYGEIPDMRPKFNEATTVDEADEDGIEFNADAESDDDDGPNSADAKHNDFNIDDI
ncbi:Translation initiation factor 1A [Coemansia erecta]|uniref:Translation initiation factor 1A n=1 Tax=Coemansia erecta TaxID=147472 RepID=A0A9W8CRP0_9FUNG|nr:Translation initiation factor 1A [Coemansia erecta]